METDFKAMLIGESLAVKLAINALIVSHPDKEAVCALLDGQLREYGTTFFLSNALPDQALQTFGETLDFVLGKDARTQAHRSTHGGGTQ